MDLPNSLVPRKRGRPRKELKPLDDQLEDLLLRMYDWSADLQTGQLKATRNHEVCTLEDAALLLWASEGRKTKQPMTKMGLLQLENKALRKMREGLKKHGITSLEDVLDIGKHRQAACYDRLEES